MFGADLVLLHAPSVYDFRDRPILYGPVSDVVPSTQIFEMYPIGFMTLLEYLQRHGHTVRILNIAAKMLQSRRFDVAKAVRSLKPVLFGVDLHWLVHAQGSLALAAVVKEQHPDVPVVFGGLSASYFHEELIQYPQVDFVLRGDSTEEPLQRLLSAIKGGGSTADVPNLTWKQGDTVRVNERLEPPSDLNGIAFDYRTMMRSSAKHFDVSGHLPFADWLRYPIVAAPFVRGCVNNCVYCGGSSSAYKRTCQRSVPAFRSPELVAGDIGLAARHMHGPVIFLGDIFQAGDDYAARLLGALKGERVNNHIAFELFRPLGRPALEMVADAVPSFNIQISPESHDESIRRRLGKAYGNASLEGMFEDARDLGCKRMDVFFMIGLAGQTADSVRGTVRYCRTMLEQMGSKAPRWLHPYVAPLAPFLDPGSRGFVNPGQHGYKLFFRTLEEHRRALLAPSWKYTLNYETECLSRDDIVRSTYEAALALNALRSEFGLVDAVRAERIERRITTEWQAMDAIDAICADGGPDGKEEEIRRLLGRHRCVGPTTTCHEDEMKWPARVWRFNPFRLVLGALTGGGMKRLPAKAGVPEPGDGLGPTS